MNNPFIKEIAKKNTYTLEKRNGLNYLSIAFGICPFVNAVTRTATQEEKECVFKGFLLQTAYELVPSTKRGHKGEEVKQFEESVLVAERVKRRQTKLQDEAMSFLEKQIADNNLAENAMILLTCEPGEVESGLRGLVANKVQAKYQRPCAVLTQTWDTDKEEYVYSGSMRNYSLSEKDNLKYELEETGLVEGVYGHNNAAGLVVRTENLEPLNAAMNERYSEQSLEPIYWVDYAWTNKGEIDGNTVLSLGELDIYGQEMPESKIAIQDISISPEMVTLMSADKNPTIKITLGDTSLIKFKASQELYDELCDDDIMISAICKPQINHWNGVDYPQLIADEFEYRQEWVF